MSNGYIKLHRELLRHEKVISAPVAYRWVLITILDYMCYSTKEVDDHGVTIKLFPGQLCTTIRQLAEWANVDKNEVERALTRFSKAEILRQEVRHKKTIITLLIPSNIGSKKNLSETDIETKVRQERDTNKEGLERLYIKEEQQQVANSDVVVPIEEGYRYIEEIFEKVPVCMLCCVDPPVTAAEIMQNITVLNLSASEVIGLIRRYSEKIHHVMLAIHWAYLNFDKIHTSVMGTITQNCKSENPWDFPKKKITPKELVKMIFTNGQSFFENENRIDINYNETEIAFTNHLGYQKNLKYNSDRFEDKLCAIIEHYKLPIDYQKYISKAA